MICHTTGCPAAAPYDPEGRRTSVMHNGLTQSLLGPTGHHLLNRQIEGTLREHLKGWDNRHDVLRALHEVSVELTRARKYAEALDAVYWDLDARLFWTDK